VVFDKHLSNWDVSQVTNMSYMFSNAIEFKGSLYSWDVRNVTNMSSMFSYATSFYDVDIDNWNVSNVTDMSYMFRKAVAYNEAIGDWDVSSVRTMRGMFEGATVYNSWLDNWDVSNVTDMSYMFKNAEAFDSNIGSWDVSKVTNMAHTFNGATSLTKNISSWNVPKITTRPNSFTASGYINGSISNEPEWGVNKLEGTVARVEGCEVSDIVNDHDLTTKEYVDSVLPIIPVDQGNGVGYIISGRDETMFGNVGLRAFDLSTSDDSTGIMGATGESSFALSHQNIASGGGSFSTGTHNKSIGEVTASFGYRNEAIGYSSTVFGTFSTTGGHYSFSAGVNNVASEKYTATIGQALLSKTKATSVFGQANTDYDTTGMGLNSGTKPVFIVGNGDTEESLQSDLMGGFPAITRSDALIVYKSGKIVAPSLDIGLITEPKDLTTKEYVDTNAGGSGYSHTGAFADKPTTNDRVWQAGEGINYNQIDVNAGLWKVLSLNEAVHLEVDNPYWTDPAPDTITNGVFTNTNTGKGLFQGKHLPSGVSSLVDYAYSYDDQHFVYTNKVVHSDRCISFTRKNGVTINSGLPGIEGVGASASKFIFTNNTGTIQENFQVHPGSTYTFQFWAKADATTPSFNPLFSLRDLSHDENLIEGAVLDNLNTVDYRETTRTFTAPVGCYEVALRFATANNTSGNLFIDQPQFNDGSTVLTYVETTGVPARNNIITHGYYEYSGNTETGYEGSTGRIKLNDLRVGDQLRVRFDFNIIPQIANTTVEPALWYSNRDENDAITGSFPLTTQPIFYGSGTVGNTFLNRPEISAWIASEEDINALALPAIKSDNPVIIQPLGLLITIIR
jgi:surface protein